MEKGTKTFEKALEELRVEREPSEVEPEFVAKTESLYNNLHSGAIRECVTYSVKLFAHSCLPELTPAQALELHVFVHTMIETTLSYLIEDGLIKEE